jgi:hypothetical protein
MIQRHMFVALQLWYINFCLANQIKYIYHIHIYNAYFKLIEALHMTIMQLQWNFMSFRHDILFINALYFCEENAT